MHSQIQWKRRQQLLLYVHVFSKHNVVYLDWIGRECGRGRVLPALIIQCMEVPLFLSLPEGGCAAREMQSECWIRIRIVCTWHRCQGQNSLPRFSLKQFMEYSAEPPPLSALSALDCSQPRLRAAVDKGVERPANKHYLDIRIFHIHSVSYSNIEYIRIWIICNTRHYHNLLGQAKKCWKSGRIWETTPDLFSFHLISKEKRLKSCKNAVLQDYTPEKGGNYPFKVHMNIEHFIFE